MQDQPLAKLDLARHALAECKTAMEAKQIADVAEAARVYLERTNASVETVNEATEIRLLAERQMGFFLSITPNANALEHGGGHYKTALRPERNPNSAPSLKEMGITGDESSRAQKLAKLPEPEFKERIATIKAGGDKLTTTALIGPRRRSPQPFNLSAWEKQTRSVMATWLRSVPPTQRQACADFLSDLPVQILTQITYEQ